MKRIDIQGVIVPAIPAKLAELFGAGELFSPSNLFTKALREAEEAGEDVEVWINSPGGDVDAGNEMLAAFQSFKGYKCVTVGGLAASMAAYFALQCGARVECHENSRFMFHSAATVADGGAGALRDAAAAIDRINEPVMARLKELGVPAETVDEGFAEGRAFYLSAAEALEYGIVQKIVKGAAAAPRRATPDDLSAVTAANPRLAALLRAAALEPENTPQPMNEPDPQPADPAPAPAAPAADPAPAAGDPAPAGDPPAPAPADPDKLSVPAPAPTPDPATALAAALSKAEALAAATLARAEAAEKALADAKATIAQYEKAAADLGARASALAEALDKEKAQHAALVGKVLAPADAPASWTEAVRKLGVEAAARLYPDLALAYREKNARK